MNLMESKRGPKETWHKREQLSLCERIVSFWDRRNSVLVELLWVAQCLTRICLHESTCGKLSISGLHPQVPEGLLNRQFGHSTKSVVPRSKRRIFRNTYCYEWQRAGLHVDHCLWGEETWSSWQSFIGAIVLCNHFEDVQGNVARECVFTTLRQVQVSMKAGRQGQCNNDIVKHRSLQIPTHLCWCQRSILIVSSLSWPKNARVVYTQKDPKDSKRM